MPIEGLIEGFRAFCDCYFEKDTAFFADLVTKGQHPFAAIVACADSRVSPNMLFGTRPGELFVVRNVANLFPPAGLGIGKATVAGIEFAVVGLGVRQIIVLGHSHCGGIRALIEGREHTAGHLPYVTEWVSIFEPVRRQAEACPGHATGPDAARFLEKAAIRASLANLRTYDWIGERLAAGTLRLHGWYFDLAAGSLSALDGRAGTFMTLAQCERVRRPVVPA